ATATAAAATGLSSECESFLTRYSCFLTKSGKPTTESDDMRREWTKTVAAAPATRDGIDNVCKKQLEIQAAAFDKAGCTSGATAATASTAPSKSATPAPTP